jgi:single-strand DNA-binding protein
VSINRVNISGNLTRDAELRATSGGTTVLSFGVAVNDRRKNQQTGEWEDVANFVDCTLFGKRADALSRYLTKGTKVAIDGKLRYSSWEKDGQRHSALRVVVDEIEFLSRNQSSAPAPMQSQPYAPSVPAAPQPQSYDASTPAPAPAPSSPVQNPPSADVYDADIPF